MEIVQERNNQSLITPKRIKVEENMEEMEEDRLSALPDDLLLEILCRLPYTETAIRTGILSKRWKYLWTFIPTLIFIFHKFYDKRPRSKFISFVNKTLTQCHQSKLRKFAIEMRYNVKFKSQFNNWIRYAISCNVEELDLNFGSGVPFVLNEYFFNNSCFTHLRLRGCMFDPIGVISWKRLKRLWISEGNFGADVIENIISGSPMLEKLVLDEYYGIFQLDITSKGIKKLKLDFDWEFESEVDDWMLYALSCNIEELHLDFHTKDYKPEFMLNEEFFINSSFTCLKLRCFIFKPKGVIDWKRLRTLYIDCGKLDEDAIENILFGSPLLETLVLKNCYGYGRLNITSTSVTNLVYTQNCDHNCELELPDVIEINAPNILSLTIRGYLHLVKLWLSNVSSLVEAKLYIKDVLHDETTLAEEEMLKGFIISLRHVKVLKIGASCFKDAYKQAMLEKYKEVMLEKYKLAREPECVLTSSMSKEVQQLKEKLQKLEHELAEREVDREQLKEKIHKMEQGQVEREAEWEARDAQRETKMKEMQDKLNAFEELLFSRFPDHLYG